MLCAAQRSTHVGKDGAVAAALRPYLQHRVAQQRPGCKVALIEPCEAERNDLVLPNHESRALVTLVPLKVL